MSDDEEDERKRRRRKSDERKDEEDGDSDVAGDDEVFDGFREFKWPNGDVYRGQWRSNLMHGNGKFQCAGGIYQGEFYQHTMNGTGRYDFKAGGSYYGTFIHGKREGKGVMNYPNTSVFQGQFLDNNRQGFGTLEYHNGDIYEGEWKDDQRTGEGVYWGKQKTEIFKGQFVNNKRQGKGEMWIEDPDKQGEFLKYVVEYHDGTLKRKRSRPPSQVPWPQQTPRADWEKIKYMVIDTGDGLYQQEQPPHEQVGQQKKAAETQEATMEIAPAHDSDDDDNHPANHMFKPSNNARPMSDDQLDDYIGITNKKDSWALEDPGMVTKPSMFRALCCGATDKIHDPAMAKHSAFVSMGPGGRKRKIDTVVVVRLQKALYLPAVNKDGTIDCYVVAGLAGNRQSTQIMKGSLSPAFSHKFEFPFEMDDDTTSKEVVLRLFYIPRNGSGKMMGKVVLDLQNKIMGYRSEMKSHFLTNEEGNKPVMGRIEKGPKIGSQLRLSYELTLVSDALLTLNVEKGIDFRCVDPTTFGSPFLRVSYNEGSQQTKPAKNHENPVWKSFVSFEVHSRDALHRLQLPHKLFPNKLLVEAMEHFMFGPPVFIGEAEIDLSHIPFGLGHAEEPEVYDLQDPDRPGRKIGQIAVGIMWGMNEKTQLRVHIEEGFNLPLHAYGTPPKLPKATVRNANPTPLPIDSSLSVVLDREQGKIKKTQVVKATNNPEWNEKVVFMCRQNELPTSLTLECFDHRQYGGPHLVGRAEVDLRQLELDGRRISRWCRLEHEDLVAAANEIERLRLRDERIFERMKKGLDFEVENEEDGEEAVSIGANSILAKVLGKQAVTLVRQTPAGKARAKLKQHVAAVKSGVDPYEQGRVKISIQWLTEPDEDDIIVQKMWDQQMQIPANRKIVRRLVAAWSRELLYQGMESLKRNAALSKSTNEQSNVFYKERAEPRHFKAWAAFLNNKHNSTKFLREWNKRNRTRPVFEEWHQEFLTQENLRRLDMGLAPKLPGPTAPIVSAPYDIAGGNFEAFDKMEKKGHSVEDRKKGRKKST